MFLIIITFKSFNV